MAKLLMQSGANPTKPKSDGVTLFHLAAASNDVRLLAFALAQDRHFTVDLQTKDGYTPA